MDELRPTERINDPPTPVTTSNPRYFLLSASDRNEYQEMSKLIEHYVYTQSLGLGVSSFIENLLVIHQFIDKPDGMAPLRCLVCGIIFARGSIVVNTVILKELLHRSKSNINHSFQLLGFSQAERTRGLDLFFSKVIPHIPSGCISAKNWSIRTVENCNLICFMPVINAKQMDILRRVVKVKSHGPPDCLSIVKLLNHIPSPRNPDVQVEDRENILVGEYLHF